jgi:hypothetical protein
MGFEQGQSASTPVRFEGVHCTMEVARRARGVVVLTIMGSDIGELADAPFKAIEAALAEDGKVELFIDARETRGASVDVSNEWALWLRKHRNALHQVTLVTGSSFIRLTADFVRRFAELEGIMRITTDRSAFDDALADAIRARSAKSADC